MTIGLLILHFLRLDAIEILPGDYLVLEINKHIPYKKIGGLIHFSIFPTTFPTACFLQSIVQGSIQMAYG